MRFEEFEIRTKELIAKFDNIEKRKKELLERLQTKDKVTIEDLKELRLLLESEEIPLLRIVLKELEFVEERRRVLRNIAIRKGYDEFFWNIVNKVGDLRKAVSVFLERAERDAETVGEISKYIVSFHDESYEEHPQRYRNTRKEIRRLAKKLTEDIKLEERLESQDAYEILEDYLRFAATGMVDRESKSMIARVLKGSNLGRMAACILITLGLTAPAFAQSRAETQVVEQRSFIHTVISGESLWKIWQKYREITPSLDAIKIANHNPSVLKPGQRIIIPLKPGAEPPPQIRSKYHSDGDFSKDHPQVLLTRCLFGEGEGCNERSKEALVAVMLFRLWTGQFGGTLHDVILKPKAFSCFNTNDPTFPKVLDPEIYGKPGEWEQCLAISGTALKGELISPINLALHYRDSSVGRFGDEYILVAEIPNGKGDGFFVFYLAKDEKVSEHFKVREFLTPNCYSVQIDPQIIVKLEELRERAGKPVEIWNVRQQDRIVFIDVVSVRIDKWKDAQMKEFAKKYGYEFKDGLVVVRLKGVDLDANAKTAANQPEIRPIPENRPISTGMFTFPIRTRFRISDKFGLRVHPVTKEKSMHNGIDIAAPRGTPIFSVGKGTVFSINENSKTAGKLVIVKYENGYMAEYMHMDDIFVKLGQEVDEDTVIGTVGSTGISKGPHLHFGAFRGTGWAAYKTRGDRYVDPLSLF